MTPVKTKTGVPLDRTGSVGLNDTEIRQERPLVDLDVVVTATAVLG
jgi:hypothetical protein